MIYVYENIMQIKCVFLYCNFSYFEHDVLRLINLECTIQIQITQKLKEGHGYIKRNVILIIGVVLLKSFKNVKFAFMSICYTLTRIIYYMSTRIRCETFLTRLNKIRKYFNK